MSGIFITPIQSNMQEVISEMDRRTNEWFARAARGECNWICPDCCCVFPDGMPDECAHGHQGCTDLIQRDKAAARGAT